MQMIASCAPGRVVAAKQPPLCLLHLAPHHFTQMIASCAPGRVVAALRLERFNVFNKQLLEQGKGELTLWTETAEQLAGSQLPDVHQHPLTKYSQCSDCNAKQLLFKSIYQVSLGWPWGVERRGGRQG